MMSNSYVNLADNKIFLSWNIQVKETWEMSTRVGCFENSMKNGANFLLPELLLDHVHFVIRYYVLLFGFFASFVNMRISAFLPHFWLAEILESLRWKPFFLGNKFSFINFLNVSNWFFGLAQEESRAKLCSTLLNSTNHSIFVCKN